MSREKQSTEQIRRLFARYRAIAHPAPPVVEDAPAEAEFDEAPDKIPATVER